MAGALADDLPASKNSGNRPKNRELPAVFNRKEKCRRGGVECAGNFLPRAEETHGAICAGERLNAEESGYTAASPLTITEEKLTLGIGKDVADLAFQTPQEVLQSCERDVLLPKFHAMQ